MKTLQDYINESILDDEKMLVGDATHSINNIFNYIKENCRIINIKKVVDELNDKYIKWIQHYIPSFKKLNLRIKVDKVDYNTSYVLFVYENYNILTIQYDNFHETFRLFFNSNFTNNSKIKAEIKTFAKTFDFEQIKNNENYFMKTK